jgi:hypothetical protein
MKPWRTEGLLIACSNHPQAKPVSLLKPRVNLGELKVSSSRAATAHKREARFAFKAQGATLGILPAKATRPTRVPPEEACWPGKPAKFLFGIVAEATLKLWQLAPELLNHITHR